MEGMIVSLSTFKGYLDGLQGNPQGAAIKKGGMDLAKIGKKALGFGLMAVGAGLTPFTAGTSVPLVAGGAILHLAVEVLQVMALLLVGATWAQEKAQAV
jgi:hypothetical protein